MMNDQKFVDGLWVDRRQEAPEFVVCSLSFHEPRFAEYLAKNVNQKGYVNIDILRSREGKLYAKLNDWKPKSDELSQETPQENPFDEIPFG